MPTNKTEVRKGDELSPVSGFNMLLRRKPVPYISLYFAPCFVMVITSWISFAVNFDVVPGRLGLLLTLLLMMINMNNSISQIIPKSEGICPLILWIFISIIFIIFALAEYFIILINFKFGGLRCKVSAIKSEREKMKTFQSWASGFDKMSLAVFPPTYFVCVFVFIICTNCLG